MLSTLPLQSNVSISISSQHPTASKKLGTASFTPTRKMLTAQQSWLQAEDDSESSLEDRSSCPKPAAPSSKGVVDLTRSAVVDLVGNPKQKSPM